jgi:hypothetical protein
MEGKETVPPTENTQGEKQAEDYLDWLPVAMQAIKEEHNVLIARICTLLEATISSNLGSQLTAIKRTMKDIVREEQDRMNDYLDLRAYPNHIHCEPATYKRFWVGSNNGVKND